MEQGQAAAAVGAGDLRSWRLSDALLTCSVIRGATSGCSSMEAAAQALVESFRSRFLDPLTGKPVFVLARLFVTQELQELPEELRAAVGEAERLPGTTRVLSLLATDGDQAEWRDRRLSRGHRAIPLVSEDAVQSAPMVAALVRDLGLGVESVLTGPTDEELRRASLDVFHVLHARGSSVIPDQEFVERHQVSSVLGFGGVLPTGEIFAVVLFSRVEIPPDTADLFRIVALSVKLALLPSVAGAVFEGQPRERQRFALTSEVKAGVLEEMLEAHERTSVEQARALEQRDEQLRREAEIVETLRAAGEALSAVLDVDAVVSLTTTAAVEITGAEFGAFFYNLEDERGESYTLYTLAGASREAFEGFPMPRNTEVFGPTFRGEHVVRSDDITQDPRYGRMAPHHGMPPGHLPVRSYLAVPVSSPTSGDVLGGLFFGHHEVGVFDERAERLALGIAAQTATALDNALMYRRERETAVQLQQALLPAELTPPKGLEIAHCYRPGTTGLHVGGDWYDLIAGARGTVGLVIGDVMGRGVRAAATMGQLRTSIRAFAALELRPAEIALMLNQIVLDLPDEQIATFVYAHYDPDDRALTFASAGHLPPVVVSPDGEASAVWVDLGPPLGIPGATFREHRISMPPGSAVTLFTDGLVESRTRPAEDGVHAVEELLSSIDMAPSEICDKLLDSLPDAANDDDIALLYARMA